MLPLWLEVYFFWYEFSYTFFFQLSFARSITLYTFNFSLFVFRTGECLGGSIDWVCCLLIPLATVCLLTDKFNQFTFSVIVDIWGFSIAILSLVFWLFCIQIASFSFCFCHFSLVALHDFFFNFPLFYDSTLDIFCGYCEVCLKVSYLKQSFFLLIASYLHLTIWIFVFFFLFLFVFWCFKLSFLMLWICYRIEGAVVNFTASLLLTFIL